MNRFLIIAVTVLLALFAFFGFRITGIGQYSWLVSGIITGLLLLYPLIWYDLLPAQPGKILRAIVHFDMGLLSMMLFFILVRDVIFVPLLLTGHEYFAIDFTRPVTSMLFGVSFILVFWGLAKAVNGPKIKQVKIPVNGLAAGLSGFTIVQISDLHAGAGIGRNYVENVMRQVISIKADLIVLTGDIADGSFEKYKNHVEPLKQLVAKSPVLYIVGNHEYLKDSDQWLACFKAMGIQVLLNEHTVIHQNGSSILLAGVIDPAVKEVHPTKKRDLFKALDRAPVTDLSVLLAHRPDIAKSASTKFDLQLSGHTHGGQFFPWNLLMKVFVPFSNGLNKIGKMWVYTNPGTGFWGPPIRLGTTSEITILELTGQSC